MSTDIFDDVIEGTEQPVETAETAVEEPTSKYPNVVERINSDSTEAPTGTYAAKDFAGQVTIRNMTEKGISAENIVPVQNVINRLTAKRNPLPVVLVVAADGTESAYIPWDAGLAVWDAAPSVARGDAAPATRSVDELLHAAAEVNKKLVFRLERHDRSAELLSDAQKLVDKYTKWLSDRDLTWDDVATFEKSKA